MKDHKDLFENSGGISGGGICKGIPGIIREEIPVKIFAGSPKEIFGVMPKGISEGVPGEIKAENHTRIPREIPEWIPKGRIKKNPKGEHKKI